MQRPSLAAIALLSFLLASCDRQEAVKVERAPGTETTTETRTMVSNARVNLPAVPGRPGVAYFIVGTGSADELLAVTTPVARVELHETVSQGGMTRMQPVSDTRIPAGGTLEFNPGGNHAMLFNIDPAVKAGGEVPLTFTFRHAPPVTVQAQVGTAGDMGDMEHMRH